MSLLTAKEARDLSEANADYLTALTSIHARIHAVCVNGGSALTLQTKEFGELFTRLVTQLQSQGYVVNKTVRFEDVPEFTIKW